MTATPHYSDSTRMPVAFGVSVLLHLLLLGSLIAFVWNKTAPINLQHTLELVDGPAPSDSNSSTDSSTSAADSTALSQPSISAINYPTITTPSPEPPTPTPPTLTTPPTPTTPSPPLPTPNPTSTHQAKPTPTPTPTQPKTMSYAEFAKEHHLSTNPTPAPAMRAGTRGVPNVGINTGGIVKNLNNLANGTGHGTANGHSSTTSSANNENYADYLAKRLGDAFKPPNAVSGLTADIELTIGPDGEIHQKLIIRKSGIEAFDAAVQDALNSLTNVDPPPSGQTETFRFTFTPH